jgi:hypothetical protein
MTNLKYGPTEKTLTCFYCIKTGLIIKDFHALIVAEAGVKGQSNIMTISKKLYVAALVVNEGHEDTWYTNIGATHHMSHDISLFVTYTTMTMDKWKF